MSFRRLGLLLALPTVVGLSLAACGTEDDAAPAPGPAKGGSGSVAGTGGTDETGGGTGGTEATGGSHHEGGRTGGGGEASPGGAGGDSSAGSGGDSAGGDGPGNGGEGNSPGAGGEGGAPGPVACHTIIQGFDADPGGAMGKYSTPSSGPVAATTFGWNSTQGVALAGSGQLNATFGAFSEKAQLSLYFPAGTHWTCQTKLHAKVKLVSTTSDNISHINGVNLNINSSKAVGPERYSLKFTSSTGWAMDTWYSVEFAFAAADYTSPTGTLLPDFNDVNSIGIMVETKSVGITPVPTTLYVDDVWVE